MEEELPYDVSATHLELTPETYPIWFFDMLDTPERYENKSVSFLATVVRPDGFPAGHFVPGRSAMTCCADDIAFLGFVAKYKDAAQYEKGDWIYVTADVKHEYWADYKGVGPVLYVKEVKRADKPKEEVLNLV